MSETYKSKEWLEQEYKNKSLRNIADECNVTPAAILYWMKKYNISRRKQQQAIDKHFDTSDMLYKNKEWLEEQYITQKKSSSDIAKEIGCTGRTIIRWLRKYNIPVRSKIEGVRNYYRS